MNSFVWKSHLFSWISTALSPHVVLHCTRHRSFAYAWKTSGAHALGHYIVVSVPIAMAYVFLFCFGDHAGHWSLVKFHERALSNRLGLGTPMETVHRVRYMFSSILSKRAAHEQLNPNVV